jgi:hypothetical protein
MFVIAFGLGWYIMNIFEREGESIEKLDSLFIWSATATRARLGHVLFYDWEYFRNHLLEIFLPVRFSPTFEFTFKDSQAMELQFLLLLLYFFSKKILQRPYFGS